MRALVVAVLAVLVAGCTVQEPIKKLEVQAGGSFVKCSNDGGKFELDLSKVPNSSGLKARKFMGKADSSNAANTLLGTALKQCVNILGGAGG